MNRIAGPRGHASGAGWKWIRCEHHPGDRIGLIQFARREAETVRNCCKMVLQICTSFHFLLVLGYTSFVAGRSQIFVIGTRMQVALNICETRSRIEGEVAAARRRLPRSNQRVGFVPAIFGARVDPTPHVWRNCKTTQEKPKDSSTGGKDLR